jgi:hypothetical protein
VVLSTSGLAAKTNYTLMAAGVSAWTFAGAPAESLAPTSIRVQMIPGAKKLNARVATKNHAAVLLLPNKKVTAIAFTAKSFSNWNTFAGTQLEISKNGKIWTPIYSFARGPLFDQETRLDFLPPFTGRLLRIAPPGPLSLQDLQIYGY